MRTAKPTIYTVAELAGVSISTVSRILNKTYRGTEAIRKRVENAIRKTNFQPSPVARRLTGKAVSSQMIGIMAPFFINPFFVEVLKGIYKVIHSAGYHAMLYDVDSKIIKKSTLKRIQDDGFLDGVLLVNMHLNVGEYDALTRLMPAVLVAAQTDFADSVAVDNYKGMLMGVDYVHGLGHRHLGFINNENDIYETRIREQAFLDRARALGIEYKIDYRNVDRRSGYLGTRNMVENNPGLSCLVYYSDLMAFGGLDYLHEAGLRERISLIGFDGFEMTFQVGLTTVVQPMERMGEEGARILLAKISGASSERVSTLLDPWLYKGATCMRVSDEQ